MRAVGLGAQFLLGLTQIWGEGFRDSIRFGVPQGVDQCKHGRKGLSECLAFVLPTALGCLGVKRPRVSDIRVSRPW